MIAALYVDPRGCYAGLDGVEIWDEARDARRYPGPYPVVAHPPCARWCRLAGLVEARWGHKRGDDGGTFEAALAAVRRWGGVLEHPAYSDAWATFRLPVPHRGGGWQRGLCGGWSCHVEQGRYGHRARKATWLYAYRCVLPTTLKFGESHEFSRVHWRHSAKTEQARLARHARVSFYRNHSTDTRPSLSKKEASATPDAFRDVLLAMARSVQLQEVTA